MTYDIVIHNGTIVTVNPDFDIIEDGVVCIKDGVIQSVGKGEKGKTLPEAADTINADGGIIMPGLVNTHTHLAMSLFRGVADDLPLMTWLNDHIFPAELKFINPENVRLGALLSCAEMMLSGTTCCCDGYFFEDNTAQAVQEIGMRAILGQGVIDLPAPGVPNPDDNISHAVKYVEKWMGRTPLIQPSIFCHSPYTCSNATLKNAKAVALSLGLMFQIHAAETKWEYEPIESMHHETSIAYLDRIEVLDSKTLLVHAVWLDDDDISLIADSGATIAHNPESNMKLASGTAPVHQLLNAGITVGLGTDSCASNNDLDMFSEMDSMAKLHKVVSLDPAVMDAKTVLKSATIDGARAIGLEKEIGSIEVGKQADIIVINTDQPHLVPMYNPVSHIVYAVKGSDVRDAVIGGKCVVRDRELLTVDVGEIMKKVKGLM